MRLMKASESGGKWGLGCLQRRGAARHGLMVVFGSFLKAGSVNYRMLFFKICQVRGRVFAKRVHKPLFK
jgi:hypothetical protein